MSRFCPRKAIYEALWKNGLRTKEAIALLQSVVLDLRVHPGVYHKQIMEREGYKNSWSKKL